EKPGMSVVGTATSCEAALERANASNPDVIGLDVGLVEEHGAGVISQLIGGWDRRVLILTSGKGNRHEAAIMRGACGLVRKLWLDRSTTGRLFVELSRRKQMVMDPGRENIASLTGREQDVVRSRVSRPSADNTTLAPTVDIGGHTPAITPP